MILVTLDSIETLARLYADQRTSSGATAQFIDQTESRSLINQEGRKLYGLCIAARPEFYAIEKEGTLSDPLLGACVSGRRLFVPMPKCPPFRDLLGVEIKWSTTDIEPIDPIRAADSHRYESAGLWGRYSPKGYVIGGSPAGNEGFYVSPGPAALDGTVLRIRYTQAWQDLGTKTCADCDNDSFNAVDGWDNLIALGVARLMRGIQRSPPDPFLESEYAAAHERVERMASERNAQEPLEIRDVEPRFGPRYRNGWWGRLPPAP
jgi:hypothetical protein